MKEKEKKNKLLTKRNIARFFFPSLIIVFVVCLLGCMLDRALGLTEYLFGSYERAESIVTDCFLVEVQVTFIVVSLSTVLSTRSKRVYWVDSFQYRLVRPKYTNFTALTSYILSTLAAGTAWMIIDRCAGDFCGLVGVLFSFLLSIVFMIILSVRMIGANFGEEAIKAELEEELEKCLKGQEITEHAEYDVGLRIPMVRDLVQVTFQEAEEKQLDHVCDNLNLMCKMGLRHELKRCYDYVARTVQSPEVMDEIDFTLMRTAVRENNEHFFCSDCPLSLDSLLRWWGEMIDERFDEAILLWIKGRKDEAKRIRKDLYALFSQTMFYQVFFHDGFVLEELSEPQTFQIVYLMGRFVRRRIEVSKSRSKSGEIIELGDEWNISERKLLDDPDQIGDAANLVMFAVDALNGRKDSSCSEDEQSIREASEFTLQLAKQF